MYATMFAKTVKHYNNIREKIKCFSSGGGIAWPFGCRLCEFSLVNDEVRELKSLQDVVSQIRR